MNTYSVLNTDQMPRSDQNLGWRQPDLSMPLPRRLARMEREEEITETGYVNPTRCSDPWLYSYRIVPRRRRQAQRVQTAVNRLFVSSLGLFLLALLVG